MLRRLAGRGRRALAAAEAAQLARLLLWLEHPGATGRLVPGAAGVQHVLVDDAPAQSPPGA